MRQLSKRKTIFRRIYAGLSAGVAVLFAAQSASAANFANKAIIDLLMDVNSRPCLFFTLDGVTVADPVVPWNPWFAVPKSASNFAEINAMLLSAKLAGRPISVETDGTTSCGIATVSWVNLK
jgi:hypothetical protein